ncbi:unnamed protein product [Aphis gossypii]|uniref:Secreted protein n=1 Tax=Aphis gossypii TaxID=80765 RepID=A0A9P0JH17_APHGO|nr:unnamed protein product [Aphis gossypii]
MSHITASAIAISLSMSLSPRVAATACSQTPKSGIYTPRMIETGMIVCKHTPVEYQTTLAYRPSISRTSSHKHNNMCIGPQTPLVYKMSLMYALKYTFEFWPLLKYRKTYISWHLQLA